MHAFLFSDIEDKEDSVKTIERWGMRQRAAKKVLLAGAYCKVGCSDGEEVDAEVLDHPWVQTS